MSTRRTLLCGAAGVLASSAKVFAQPTSGKVHRFGILLFSSPQVDGITPLLESLGALGYAENRTAKMDYRFAQGIAERLPGLAAELVQLKPDLIFAFGGDVVPHVKAATTSIPIVTMVSNDAVQSGLISSYAKPGGNVTGMTLVYDELAGKVLDLLKEALPRLSKISILWNPAHADPEFRETNRVAVAQGMHVQSLEVRRADDFDPAFESAVNARTEAIVVVPSRVLLQQRRKIIEFSHKHRIPMVSSWGNWARDGLLLTYGPNPLVAMQLMANYADKILKGEARPGDLPMERPSRFEIALNLKTAKAFDIQVPASLLARADEVIE